MIFYYNIIFNVQVLFEMNEHFIPGLEELTPEDFGFHGEPEFKKLPIESEKYYQGSCEITSGGPTRTSRRVKSFFLTPHDQFMGEYLPGVENAKADLEQQGKWWNWLITTRSLAITSYGDAIHFPDESFPRRLFENRDETISLQDTIPWEMHSKPLSTSRMATLSVFDTFHMPLQASQVKSITKWEYGH